MKQPIWTQSYEVASFLADTQKRLGLYSLLNLLQDTAWLHATHLGHGFDSIREKNMIWVLTRQKVVMHSWPHWGESLQLRTWVRPPSGPFAYRDFEILHKNQVIGMATTSWVMMDVQTRRPIKTGLNGSLTAFRTDGHLSFDAPKVEVRSDLEDCARFDVRTSDLDVNQHVNNTRYTQWVLDSVPMKWHERFTVMEYDVNFLAETHAGDLITVQMSKGHDGQQSPGWTSFQGRREADQKIVFTARALWK